MVDLISPALMANLRALDESAMPSSCRVLRREITHGAGQSEYEEVVVVAGPVPCRLQRRTGNAREATVLGREGDEPPATVALHVGTTVADRDFVEVTTPLPEEVTPQIVTFEVQGDPWAGDYATSLMVPVWRQDERHAI